MKKLEILPGNSRIIHCEAVKLTSGILQCLDPLKSSHNLHFAEIFWCLTISEVFFCICARRQLYHACHNVRSVQIRFQSGIRMILFNFDKLCKHNMLGCILTLNIQDLLSNQKGLPFRSEATTTCIIVEKLPNQNRWNYSGKRWCGTDRRSRIWFNG